MERVEWREEASLVCELYAPSTAMMVCPLNTYTHVEEKNRSIGGEEREKSVLFHLTRVYLPDVRVARWDEMIL